LLWSGKILFLVIPHFHLCQPPLNCLSYILLAGGHLQLHSHRASSQFPLSFTTMNRNICVMAFELWFAALLACPHVSQPQPQPYEDLIPKCSQARDNNCMAVLQAQYEPYHEGVRIKKKGPSWHYSRPMHIEHLYRFAST
jgi:hypothetical protein